MRLSRLLLALLIPPIGFLVYHLFSDSQMSYTVYILPLGILLAIVLVFKHQLDSWWIGRNTRMLDPILHKILWNKVESFDALFYSDEKIATLAKYTFDCEFIGQGVNDIPDDLKYIICAHSFYFGVSHHPLWPHHYNRVVLYKHPFLSPTHTEQAHTVEHHQEDGVMIFSLEQALPGLNLSRQYYNIILHGYADAFIQLYEIDSVIPSEEIWSRLKLQLNVDKKRIETIIGFTDINPLAVVAHYYILNSKKVNPIFPELKAEFFSSMTPVSKMNKN